MAGDVMRPGPTIARRNGCPAASLAAMDRNGDDVLLVTTSDGMLVGLRTRHAAERAADGYGATRWSYGMNSTTGRLPPCSTASAISRS